MSGKPPIDVEFLSVTVDGILPLDAHSHLVITDLNHTPVAAEFAVTSAIQSASASVSCDHAPGLFIIPAPPAASYPSTAAASPDADEMKQSATIIMGSHIFTDQETENFYKYGVTKPIPKYLENMNETYYINLPFTEELYKNSPFAQNKIDFKLAKFVHALHNSIIRNCIIKEENMRILFGSLEDHDLRFAFTINKKAALEIEAQMRAGIIPIPHAPATVSRKTACCVIS